MENSRQSRYALRHEASWNRGAARTAAPTGDPAAQRGQEPVGGGTRGERVGEFGLSLGRDVAHEGTAGVAAPRYSWASAQALPRPTRAVGARAPEGPVGGWLFDGPLDAQTGRGGDHASVRRAVPSVSCLATPPQHGLELPETGAPRVTTRRRRDHALEAAPLAAYEKAPQGVAPISSSWMNRGLCTAAHVQETTQCVP